MSCERHGPPRSLQGNQDAEAIWTTIAQRFPTAAPLLCEMEEIIDRAEELLQQLRVPLQRIDAVRSTSPIESRESLALLSARESFIQEEEPESRHVEQTVAEIQVSESSETERSVGSTKSGTLDLCEELSSDVQVVTSSLDAGDHKIGSSDTLSTPFQVFQREQNFPNSQLIGPDDKMDITNIQGSGDESPLKFGGSRRPLNILEGYAERCKVPLVYQFENEGPHKYKSNVVRANIGGYEARSLGNSKPVAKNNAATKLLALIADQQMNSEKLTLPELSREELLQITEYAGNGIRDTSQSKLYRLCLEKEEPPPRYSIGKEQTYRGTTYVATCTALGFTCDGEGHGEVAAKKAAAEELYRRYTQYTEFTSKVTFSIDPNCEGAILKLRSTIFGFRGFQKLLEV